MDYLLRKGVPTAEISNLVMYFDLDSMICAVEA